MKKHFDVQFFLLLSHDNDMIFLMRDEKLKKLKNIIKIVCVIIFSTSYYKKTVHKVKIF